MLLYCIVIVTRQEHRQAVKLVQPTTFSKVHKNACFNFTEGHMCISWMCGWIGEISFVLFDNDNIVVVFIVLSHVCI